jgi:hypothetical protein
MKSDNTLRKKHTGSAVPVDFFLFLLIQQPEETEHV